MKSTLSFLPELQQLKTDIMKQVKCPDCGTEYSANLKACPECGCPNDEWLTPDAEEHQTKEPQTDDQRVGAIAQTECQEEDEDKGTIHSSFNEATPYSPFSSDHFLFRDPKPLSDYPIGELEKRHPFWGWLFGPWHLTCNNEINREQYDVINNIFYAFNLIFKAIIYPAIWTFFKAWLIVLIFIVATLLLGRAAISSNSVGLIGFIGILYVVLYIYVAIVYIFGIGRSLHRYWPQFHKVWRRLCKRFVKAMKN